MRVILSPALAFLVAKLFGLSPVFAVALVVSFSLPTAKMVLPLADENKTYVKQAAGIIALTTVSLVVVWPIVIWVCERLWPGVVGAEWVTGVALAQRHYCPAPFYMLLCESETSHPFSTMECLPRWTRNLPTMRWPG